VVAVQRLALQMERGNFVIFEEFFGTIEPTGWLAFVKTREFDPLATFRTE
jgi:hypothetical protein